MNAVYRNSPAGQSTPGVPDASPGKACGCRMLLFLSLLLGSLAAVAQPRVEVDISGVEVDLGSIRVVRKPAVDPAP